MNNLKNWPPPFPLKNYLKFCLITSNRDSHTTTDVKPEMIPNRKDDIFIQRRLYIDEAHTALDIFRFAAFFFVNFFVQTTVPYLEL